MTAAEVPAGSGAEFTRLAEPYRRELFAHCYRMLGSLHDAEDLVQETYLRAWRGYGGFEGRSSLRTWLYRIATSACLTALESRARRPLPSDLGPAGDDPSRPLAPSRAGHAWLEPVPDALLPGGPGDPAAIVGARGSVRLALVAALQHLPPRQRAVLILRDVLAWRAAEVAEVLDSTPAAVNSALQRARAQLGEVAPAEDDVTEPTGPAARELLDRYMTAFTRADVPGLVELLTADVEFEMPPQPEWFAGREIVGRFLATRLTPDGYRLVPTAANGQPAVAIYRRDDAGTHRAAGIQVLTLAAGRISRITSFFEPALVGRFGFPDVHR